MLVVCKGKTQKITLEDAQGYATNFCTWALGSQHLSLGDFMNDYDKAVSGDWGNTTVQLTGKEVGGPQTDCPAQPAWPEKNFEKLHVSCSYSLPIGQSKLSQSRPFLRTTKEPKSPSLDRHFSDSASRQCGSKWLQVA